MQHHSHVKCDDCGTRHTPGNPAECIEELKSQIVDSVQEIAAMKEEAKRLTAIEVERNTLKLDALVMALRLYGEDTATFGPECLEVMGRWSRIVKAALKGETP